MGDCHMGAVFSLHTPGHGGRCEGVGTFLWPFFHACSENIVSISKVSGLEMWQEIDR
jgi:hypothetical protein